MTDFIFPFLFLDELRLEQQNISSLLLSQTTSGSAEHPALIKSTMDPKANSVFPEGLSSHVTSPSEVTSLDQEGTSSVSSGQNVPALDISVTSNEAVLSDDGFLSSFPNAHQTSSLKSFTEDYLLGSYPVKPTKASSLPGLSSLVDNMETLQTTVQTTASAPPAPLPHLKPFDMAGVTLTPSRNLLMPPTYLNSVASWSVDATARKEGESLLSQGDTSTSLLFDAPAGGSPLFMRRISEGTQIMLDILIQSTDKYTESYYSVNSSLTGTLSPRSSSALSNFKETPVLLNNAGTSVFSTRLPFVFSPSSPTPVLTISDSLFNEELFTRDLARESSSRIASVLPGSSEKPTPAAFFSNFTSPVPFTRPYASCSYCDFTSVPPEPVFSLGPSENDVGSGDYVETLSITASEVKGGVPPTSVVSDQYDVQEFPPEIFDTSFPSRPFVSLSSRFTEDFKSGTVDISLKNTTFSSTFPYYGQSSERTPLESMPVSLSYPVTDMAILTSVITAEELPSDVTTLTLDSAFTKSVNPPSMTIKDTSLLETPKFMPSETMNLYDKTVMGFPTEESSVDRSDTPSSLLLTPFPSEPKDLSHLTSAIATSFLIMPSDLSTFLPQVSPTFLPSPVIFDRSSSLGSVELPAVDITGIEASPLPSWQTSFFNPNASSVLVTHSSTIVPSSSFYVNSSVLLEPTSTLLLESEFNFTGATSQFESSPLATASTLMLTTSVLEPVFTSSILVDEKHVTSWLPSLQTTPALTSSFLFPTTTATIEDTGATVNYSLVSSMATFFTTTQYMPPQATNVSSIVVSPTESVGMVSSSVPSEMHSPVSMSTEFGIPIRTSITESTSSLPTSTATLLSSTTGLSTSTSSTSNYPTSFSTSAVVTTPPVTMATAPATTTRQPYVCDITVPDKYLVTAGKTSLFNFFLVKSCFLSSLHCIKTLMFKHTHKRLHSRMQGGPKVHMQVSQIHSIS